MMVVMMLNFWNRVVEEQKEHNEAAGGQGRYTRLAWCTTPSERVIKFAFAYVSLYVYVYVYVDVDVDVDVERKRINEGSCNRSLFE